MCNINIGDLVKLSSWTDEDEPAGLVTKIDKRTLPHLLTVLVEHQEIITSEDEVSKV